MSGQRPLRSLRQTEPSRIVYRIALPSFCASVSLISRAARQIGPAASAGATVVRIIAASIAAPEMTFVIGSSVANALTAAIFAQPAHALKGPKGRKRL